MSICDACFYEFTERDCDTCEFNKATKEKEEQTMAGEKTEVEPTNSAVRPSESLDLRDEFAIRILIGLMMRYKESGYSDEDAIVEAYELAEQMIEYKIYLSSKK